jgi:hypothetical protein
MYLAMSARCNGLSACPGEVCGKIFWQFRNRTDRPVYGPFPPSAVLGPAFTPGCVGAMIHSLLVLCEGPVHGAPPGRPRGP